MNTATATDDILTPEQAQFLATFLHVVPKRKKKKAAEEAYNRVARILDNFRAETDFDLSSSDAEELASTMRDYMQDRRGYDEIPRPNALNGDEELDDQVLPLPPL